jgi:hypothetical protein
MNLKRRLAILSVPAVLAMGGGALAVHAASTPAPSPATSQPAETEAPDAPEAAGTAEATGAAEKADPAGAAGAGHADPAGEVDHQAAGNE